MTAILLCRNQDAPTPEQVADALRQTGYEAVAENVGGHPTTSIAAEIRYKSNRLPIIVHIYHDLIVHPDEGDYEYWDWIEELVPDAQAREGIRRFIFISAIENVEADALQTTIDYLRAQTNATVILQEQPSKQ